METVFSLVVLVLVLVWAYRVEINTAKTRESLERIEKQLAKKEGGKK